MKKIFIKLYLLLNLSISCLGQSIYYFDDMNKIMEGKIDPNSMLPLIELNIKKEGYKFCELPSSSKYSRGEWNVDIDKQFSTTVFTKMKNSTEIYLNRKNCMERYGSIRIEEWTFNSYMEALDVFKLVKTFKEKKFYSVIPSTYYWILYKNKIFHLLVEETNGTHEAHCIRDMLLEEVIKYGAYQTYSFSW